MNRRLIIPLVIIAIIAALFISAYLTNISWLWILAVGSLATTVILGLRHLANSILDENQRDATQNQGRIVMLPRPSGLGPQVGVSPAAGAGSNFLIVTQEKRKDEPVGEMHAYVPETAWTSAAKKDGQKKEF